MGQRRLIIMRHATALGAAGGSDHARPLSERGIAEAQGVGLALLRLDLVPDRVLSSTARRCRETWDALRRRFEEASGPEAALDQRIAVAFEDRLYNAAPDTLLDHIAQTEDAKTLLLLAHNPGVSMLAYELARGDEAAAAALRPGFAPASIACFECDSEWSIVSQRNTELIRFERPA